MKERYRSSKSTIKNDQDFFYINDRDFNINSEKYFALKEVLLHKVSKLNIVNRKFSSDK